MLIYDVNSFPNGVDINIWYSLYEKGLVIYDSLSGGEPHSIDSPDLSLIDVNHMTREDINSLTEAINGLNDEYATEQKEVNEVIKNNNRKLIEYLKSINEKG